MKKLFSVLIALMMIASTALACSCAPTATVRLTAQQMVDLPINMTADELEALAGIALGTEGDCSVRKTALAWVLVRNQAILAERFDTARVEALIAYIGHCCCADSCTEPAPVVTPAPTVQPTRQPQPTAQPQRTQPTPRPCQHTGGTHDNRGQCSLCGQIYQDHSTPGEWQSNNGTWHDRFCSFPGCGVKMGSGRHVWDGQTYGTSAEGLKKVLCTICHQHSWIRSGSTQVTTTENHDNGCCGCCRGEACEGQCGCGCDEE